ncbi:MAG: alkaline phosphatase [Chthoniobacterales bacterium]
MKWRNQLLALFCLLVFLAFGVFYFQYWVIQKPFGIIIFIAEGLDAQTLAEARVFAGNKDHTLALDSFPYTALLRNRSADSAVPDLAAAATALATGVRVPNGTVAMSTTGQPLTSLLELAQGSGRITGLITDGKITAPTAAAFYGHARSDDAEIDFARQLSETTALDVILGGGASEFLPAAQGGRRSDDRDLVSMFRKADFVIIQSLAELEEVPRWPRAKLFGLFREEELPLVSDAATTKDQPTLTDMVRRGIELLQFHRGGYLLVVDASLMRKARAPGRSELRMEEVMEFNRAVTVATEYAGKKSAIIVCGDVADRSGTSPISPSPEAAPQEEKAPPSDEESITRTPELMDLSAVSSSQDLGQRVKTDASSATRLFLVKDFPVPTVPDRTEFPEDVPAFGMGLGANALHGSRDSTAVFEMIRENL